MERITGLKVGAAIVVAVTLAGAAIGVMSALRWGGAAQGVLAGLLLAIAAYGDILVIRAVHMAGVLDGAAATRAAWTAELADWYTSRSYADPAAEAAAGRVRAAGDDMERLDACLGVDKATARSTRPCWPRSWGFSRTIPTGRPHWTPPTTPCSRVWPRACPWRASSGSTPTGR